MKLKFILLSLLTNIQSSNNYGKAHDDQYKGKNFNGKMASQYGSQFDEKTVVSSNDSKSKNIRVYDNQSSYIDSGSQKSAPKSNSNFSENNSGIQSSRISQNDNQGFYDASQQTDDSKFKINISDKEIVDTILSKELDTDFKEEGLDVREMLYKNLNDKEYYKSMAESLMTKEMALIYLPLTSIGLSLALITLISYASVGHKDVKKDVKFGKLFSFYLNYFSGNMLFFKVTLIAFNIGVYYVIQNFQLNLLSIIGIFMAIFFISLVILLIKIFLFSQTPEEKEKKAEKEYNEVFKPGFSIIEGLNLGLTIKYNVLEILIELSIQTIYLVYYGYKINKLNGLQSKVVTLKGGLDHLRVNKRFAEIQTKNIYENNQDQTRDTYRQSNGNFVC